MAGLDDIDDDELAAHLAKRQEAKNKDFDAIADRVADRLRKALGIEVEDDDGDDDGGKTKAPPEPKKRRGYFG